MFMDFYETLTIDLQPESAPAAGRVSPGLTVSRGLQPGWLPALPARSTTDAFHESLSADADVDLK